MKKIAVVLIVFLVVLNANVNKADFSLLNYFSGEYTAYTSSNEEDNSINLGFCYMNSNPKVKNVVGESIVVKDLEVRSALETLKARVVKTEYLDNGTIVIYAYSGLIPDQVKINNEPVNLQIAQRNDDFVIGWPLILGSF